MPFDQELNLLQRFVSIPAPSGAEEQLGQAVQALAAEAGLDSWTDAKGNVWASRSRPTTPRVIVTAHMDEICLIVRAMEPDGSLRVSPVGGIHPWKLGEGPVQVMTETPVDGVLSFGSIHTDDPGSLVRQLDSRCLKWADAWVSTGHSKASLEAKGVRVGSRVLVHPARRKLFPIGDLIAGYFLDNRAPLVSWCLALKELPDNVAFVATVAEEIGGEGASWALGGVRPEVCIALELGPNALDCPVNINEIPTVWAADSYSVIRDADAQLVGRAFSAAGLPTPQWQVLSRGGSDATCAASRGLCARHFTLCIPMDNSHGFEIIHPGAIGNLAKATTSLLRLL